MSVKKFRERYAQIGEEGTEDLRRSGQPPQMVASRTSSTSAAFQR